MRTVLMQHIMVMYTHILYLHSALTTPLLSALTGGCNTLVETSTDSVPFLVDIFAALVGRNDVSLLSK